MSKKRRKAKKATQSKSYKKFRLLQIIYLTLVIVGVLILGWCGYSKSNPFPYVNYIGMFHIFIGMLIFVMTDKSPTPKVPPTKDDIRGGYGGW